MITRHHKKLSPKSIQRLRLALKSLERKTIIIEENANGERFIHVLKRSI